MERPVWLSIAATTTSTVGLVALVISAVRLFRSADVLGRRSNLLSPSERVLARRQVKGRARYGSAQLPLLRLVAKAMQRLARQQAALFLSVALVQGGAALLNITSVRVLLNLLPLLVLVSAAVTALRAADPARAFLARQQGV